MIKTKVLFLFTANRCRTQMAEAFLRDLAGDRFDVLSAGYEEAPEICPDAVAVMREVGIDISGQLTWPVENPATVESDRERRAITSRVRDEIQRYIAEFVRENG